MTCTVELPPNKVHAPLSFEELADMVEGYDGDGAMPPMLASFWRGGTFKRVLCKDCRINSAETHTEITLTDEQDRSYLFVVTNDPEIASQMILANGKPGVFDGFMLQDHRGQCVEKITAFDSRTIQ